MSWRDAKQDGEARARLILDQVGSARPASVRLTDYEDEPCYFFLHPGAEWGFEYQRMVTRAVQRILKRDGVTVRLKTIRLADYVDWLAENGLENSTETRARFIAEQ